MRLKSLIKGLGLKADKTNDPVVASLAVDSRKAGKGSLFAALPSASGRHQDTIAYARQAVERGSVAVMSRKAMKLDAAISLSGKDLRQAWAECCSRFYGEPTKKLKLAGITGTNGKTTTAYLLRGMLKDKGLKPAMLGTVAYSIGGRSLPAPNTTPGAIEIQSLMARARKAGSKAAVMEVSSHALDQGRVEACAFDVAVFTNLTQDHLDYHRNMAAYRKAKALLFAQSKKYRGKAVWNLDDSSWKAMARAYGRKGIAYSLKKGRGDLRAENIHLGLASSEFDLVYGARRQSLLMPLAGRFNVANALAAAGAGLALGLKLEGIARSLSRPDLPPGRLQRVGKKDPVVLVDYAHTPDALQRALAAVREGSQGRVICVFGAGGDRDRSKRPLMGRAAWDGADLLLVTSDNPRTENPGRILDDIFKGIPQRRGSVMRALRLEDRSRAIRRAVKLARPGDVVLVAGKGHEDYQIIGTEKHPFSDVAEVKAALGNLN